jgi:hypothetical protein
MLRVTGTRNWGLAVSQTSFHGGGEGLVSMRSRALRVGRSISGLMDRMDGCGRIGPCRPDTGLTCIVFTELAGWRILALGAHSGRGSRLGDSVMATFRSRVDALRWAVTIRISTASGRSGFGSACTPASRSLRTEMSSVQAAVRRAGAGAVLLSDLARLRLGSRGRLRSCGQSRSSCAQRPAGAERTPRTVHGALMWRRLPTTKCEAGWNTAE